MFSVQGRKEERECSVFRVQGSGYAAVLLVGLFAVTANAADRMHSGRITRSFTEPIEQCIAASAEAGIIFTSSVKEGDAVRAGDTLAKINQSVLHQSLAIAKARAESTAQLDAAASQLEMTESQLNALEALVDGGHTNKFEVEQKQAEYQKANSEHRSAEDEQQLNKLEVKRIAAQIDDRIIKSPINGIVTEIHKQLGENVSSNEPQYATVVRVDELKVRFYLDANTLKRSELGQQVNILVGDQRKSTPTTITFISPIIDPESGLGRMDVVIDNHDLQIQSGIICHWDASTDEPSPLRDEREMSGIGFQPVMGQTQAGSLCHFPNPTIIFRSFRNKPKRSIAEHREINPMQNTPHSNMRARTDAGNPGVPAKLMLGQTVDQQILQTVTGNHNERTIRTKFLQMALAETGAVGVCFLKQGVHEQWSPAIDCPAVGRVPPREVFSEAFSEKCDSIAKAPNVQTETIAAMKLQGVFAPIRARGSQPEILFVAIKSKKQAFIATRTLQRIASSLQLWLNSQNASDSDWQVVALGAVMELAAKIQQQTNVKSACEETVNLLANQIGCGSVAIGLIERGQMRLHAISGVAKLDHGSNVQSKLPAIAG